MHSVDSIAIIETCQKTYQSLHKKMKIMPTKLRGFYFVDFKKQSNKKILASYGISYGLEIFTDYFGGSGEQWSKLFHLTLDYRNRNKTKFFKTINHGLKEHFGIMRDEENNIDQYDLIGIGSYREYDDFFKEADKHPIVSCDSYNVEIFDIKYDTSNSFDDDEGDIDIYLPDTLFHSFDCEENELEDNISEYISDTSGFCHLGFRYRII